MSIWIVGHLLAIAIGISLGLLGGGGSILAVPTLIYVVGLTPKAAIATSLFVVGVVSVIGAIPHWQQGNVNWKTAAMFAPPAMLGAYLGARLAALPFITDTIQLVSFGIMMVIASVPMIRGGKPNEKTGESPQPSTLSQPSLNPHHSTLGWLLIPAEGLGVGGLTGFVGIGGGFAIIPALVLVGGIPIKEAIGTSLVIIAFKSVTGFLGYINQVTLDWTLVLSFTLAAALGTVVGALSTRAIAAKDLQKAFGYFVLAVAVLVLVKQ
ncbi:MAG: sulfite exporter TauE/SafE family protein [Coleofasciculaceae cyanobacterium SM2_3_26]|nr:sulfite exporter TauE/SafE family protein [Coleofasciculaceae cyanobacterium SM2_3_26]